MGGESIRAIPVRTPTLHFLKFPSRSPRVITFIRNGGANNEVARNGGSETNGYGEQIANAANTRSGGADGGATGRWTCTQRTRPDRPGGDEPHADQRRHGPPGPGVRPDPRRCHRQPGAPSDREPEHPGEHHAAHRRERSVRVRRVGNVFDGQLVAVRSGWRHRHQLRSVDPCRRRAYGNRDPVSANERTWNRGNGEVGIVHGDLLRYPGSCGLSCGQRRGGGDLIGGGNAHPGRYRQLRHGVTDALLQQRHIVLDRRGIYDDEGLDADNR